jgi:serine/threonine-protein kinase
MSTALGPGSLLGGKYRLVDRIGGGGMGSVWLARHEVLDAEVAVKLMSPILADTPTAKSRFEREAKASAQLKSLHICKVQDYGIEGDTPYMVMERLEGEDLGERLARVGRMSAAELSGVVAQVARALTVAHAAGIVHRDLKPSNVFLVREGTSEIVKLLDFGIARELVGQLVDERTSSGTVIGSPHHMSPEQAHGQPVDHRSDLWSLGVVAYKALTGHRPFEGEQMTVVMLRIVSTTPAAPSTLVDGLPEGADAFFERALARDPDARFQSASDFAEAFTALASGQRPSAWLEPSTTASAPSTGLPDPRDGSQRRGEAHPEGTGSRELRAVTAGTGSELAPPTVSRGRRALPWALAGVAVTIVGLALWSRGGAEPTTHERGVARREVVGAPTLPPTATPSAAPSEVDPASPTGSASAPAPVVTPAGIASGAPSVDSPSPTATTSSRAPRPTSTTRSPARPNAAGGSVDPFTGLPVP